MFKLGRWYVKEVLGKETREIGDLTFPKLTNLFEILGCYFDMISSPFLYQLIHSVFYSEIDVVWRYCHVPYTGDTCELQQPVEEDP